MNFQYLILFLVIIFHYSCEYGETNPMTEEDCKYQFEEDIADIHGAWEPKQIINLEDGAIISFEPGTGHTGFILYDQYADSFEFRPDSTAALYYVELGRFCKSRVDAYWYTNNDTLYISRFTGDLKKLPIISLNSTELIVEDMVNFELSKAIYRKNTD